MVSLAESRGMMKGFVQGADRQQTTLLPECLDDWVDESNPVRAVDVFVDALEFRDLGFDGVDPAATGRPSPFTGEAIRKVVRLTASETSDQKDHSRGRDRQCGEPP
jgi:hypothetical protein